MVEENQTAESHESNPGALVIYFIVCTALASYSAYSYWAAQSYEATIEELQSDVKRLRVALEMPPRCEATVSKLQAEIAQLKSSPKTDSCPAPHGRGSVDESNAIEVWERMVQEKSVYHADRISGKGADGILPKPSAEQGLLVDWLDRYVAGLYADRGYRLLWTPQGSRMLSGLQTGATLEQADVELIVRLCAIRKPRRIFGVGNAFGYSSFVLSYACGNAPLDVVDAEIDDGGGVSRGTGENSRGTALTRRIAAEEGRDVSVHVGFSPQATHAALRGRNGTYGLAFIDGKHGDLNIVRDFLAVRSALASTAVVVFHDVGYFGMWRGVRKMLSVEPAAQFRLFTGEWTHNRLGTGFLYWGFPDGTFNGFGPMVSRL